MDFEDDDEYSEEGGRIFEVWPTEFCTNKFLMGDEYQEALHVHMEMWENDFDYIYTNREYVYERNRYIRHFAAHMEANIGQ